MPTKYHVQLQYGQHSHYWWNCSEKSIAERVVLPFVNGQVITLRYKGQRRLVNMKSATFMTVYKTDVAIKLTQGKGISEFIKAAAFQKNECTLALLEKLRTSKSAPQSTSLLQKSLRPLKPQVFVVMKFGDDVLESAYKAAYRLTIEKFGLKCLRIDEVEDSGKISEQILEAIAESKYVVADLSGARPNCYYEAGFAHALGKELILTMKDGESAHFDLQGHRFIQWKTESDLKKKLTQRLKALEERLDEEP